MRVAEEGLALLLLPDKRMKEHTNVELQVLYKAGKSFHWKRPSCCNGCQKMWGHGYVRRYFEGYSKCFWLKRYRCPCCGVVVTMRPTGFFPRFQSSTEQIYKALKHKLTTLRWPPWTTRQRAGHWLRRFMSKLAMDFPGSSPPELLSRLHGKMINFLS